MQTCLRRRSIYVANRSVMTSVTSLFVFICCCLLSTSSARRKTAAAAAGSTSSELRLIDNDPCYRDDGSPTRCIPEFINAAYDRNVIASSTCGNPPVDFCGHHSTTAYQRQRQQQYNKTSMSRDDDDNDAEKSDCVICDAHHQHPASYLTDLNNPHNMTSSSAATASCSTSR